jgi:hypothetical protein
MRSASIFILCSLAFMMSAAVAQQPGASGDSIGHPPPIPGPPPVPGPPPQSSSSSQPPSSEKTAPPGSGGYTGAYQPAGTPATPYSSAPLPQVSSGPGLDVGGPNGDSRIVKAVPCSVAAKETDGTTTCVGIPDPSDQRPSRKRHR